MDLFEHARDKDPSGKPFAEVVRPTKLSDFLGQEQSVGTGTILRTAIENDRLGNLVLWGPPGSGKTTLARLVARKTRSYFEPFSAVLGGVAEIRKIIKAARDRRAYQGQGTILFIDEIHRFNKAQQDALLPHLEDGTVTLIGATTENPSFELNHALLSRARVFVLQSLDETALVGVLERAWAHPERMARWPEAARTDDAVPTLARLSDGDARRALNALETALDQGKRVDGELIQAVMDRKILVYDRAGDQHYQVVSAFIKAMRASDPDAAAYYLQRMVEAGEDPLFILRRMVIFASEDIGHADPRALTVATDAVSAFRFIGLPEGLYPLMQAATYLACAPKSDTVKRAIGAAKAAVVAHGNAPVPHRYRNATTALQKQLGYGEGYDYPHHREGHIVTESALPDAVRGTRIFAPTTQGEEAELSARLQRWGRGPDDA